MTFCRYMPCICIHTIILVVLKVLMVLGQSKKDQGMLIEKLIFNIRRTASKLKKTSLNITVTTKISKFLSLIDTKRKNDRFGGFVWFTY